MKKPILRKSLEIKKCHNFEWKDYYSWIHQENILEVLRDSTKLNSEVKKYLLEENKYTNFHLKNTVKTQKLLFSMLKDPRVAIVGSEKAPAGALTHTLFLIHRRSLQRQYSEARTA